MSPTPTEDQKLCCECITAPDFMKIIESRGQTGKCDFDTFHELGPVMTVEAFAEHVDVFFREHYQLGEDAPYFVDGSDNLYAVDNSNLWISENSMALLERNVVPRRAAMRSSR